MREPAASVRDLPAVDVVVRGAVVQDEMTYAEYAVARAMASVDRPIRDPRVRMTRYRGSAPVVVVQANLAVAERLVRAQATAATVTGAVDEVVERLRHRLNLLRCHLGAEDAGLVGVAGKAWPVSLSVLPASRRSADCVGVRTLVRSKIFPLAVQDPDSAALAMELRDYDFHLFTEDATETESVVYRGGSTGFGVLRLGTMAHAVGAIALTVEPSSVPVLRVPEAIERLNGAPLQRFVFFADPRTGRGRVLYRRYDGNLGLITPVW